MARQLREAIAPTYLLLCLLFGGSGQGIWTNMVLQLLGLALIAFAAIERPAEAVHRQQVQLLSLVALVFALIIIQFVPLPPGIWQHLGGREPIVDGYRVLGMPAPWLALSVAPYDSISALLALIPGLALLLAAVRLGCSPAKLVFALVCGSLASILLGGLQVSSANPDLSFWYLYPDTNRGVATGFFANANHMADLLVLTIPFLAAILAGWSEAPGRGRRVAQLVFAGAVLIIVVGLALNGSLAGFGLAVPVVGASGLIAFPGIRKSARWLAPLATILFIAAIGWLSTTPLSSGAALRSTAVSSVQSREEILRTSLRAAVDFMPLGSGIGTFEQVYGLYEHDEGLDPTTYVNHAHNDYVEIALETGLPGVILLVLFLVWWTIAAWAKWQPGSRDPYGAAAVVASAAILLHSIVDFPLRTAAISACFAMCLAMLMRVPSPQRDKSDLWATRHVVIE